MAAGAPATAAARLNLSGLPAAAPTSTPLHGVLGWQANAIEPYARKHCRGRAVVCDNAVQTGFATAVLWFLRSRIESRIVGDMDEAIARAREQVQAPALGRRGLVGAPATGAPRPRCAAAFGAAAAVGGHRAIGP